MTPRSPNRPRATTLLLAMVVAACGVVGRQPGVLTGPDGLRTFTVARAAEGTSVLCTLGLAAHPLTGTIAGDAVDPERVWLVGPEGNRISIVWPEGFSVRFEPIVVLYDAGGQPVARAGAAVTLDQVDVEERAGTAADPYWASGFVFDACYPPARS